MSSHDQDTQSLLRDQFIQALTLLLDKVTPQSMMTAPRAEEVEPTAPTNRTDAPETASVAFRRLWLSPADMPSSAESSPGRAGGTIEMPAFPIALLAAPAADALDSTCLNLIERLLLQTPEQLAERIAPWLNARAPNDFTGTTSQTTELRQTIALQMSRRILGLTQLVALVQESSPAQDSIVQRLKQAAELLEERQDRVDDRPSWPVDISSLTLSDPNAPSPQTPQQVAAQTAQRYCFLWWSTSKAEEAGQKTISAAQWLELERLLRYLGKAEPLVAYDAHAHGPNAAHGAPSSLLEPVSIPVLTVATTGGEPKGRVEQLRVHRWNASAAGVCWDPVVRGIAVFDDPLRDSLLAARHAVRQATAQSGRAMGTYLLQWTPNGVERLSGGSAGAVVAVALLACFQDGAIAARCYVSAALEAPNANDAGEYSIPWRDIRLAPVGPRTVQRKIGAAIADALPAPAAIYFASQQAAELGGFPTDWPTWRDTLAVVLGDPAANVETTETLGALYDLLTADTQAERGDPVLRLKDD